MQAPDYWSLDARELHYLVEATNKREKAYVKLFQHGVGMLAAEIRNTMRQKRSDRVWTAEDFMPREVKKLTPDQVRQLMLGWAQANGAKVEHH